jgi:hypothetical protein
MYLAFPLTAKGKDRKANAKKNSAAANLVFALGDHKDRPYKFLCEFFALLAALRLISSKQHFYQPMAFFYAQACGFRLGFTKGSRFAFSRP